MEAINLLDKRTKDLTHQILSDGIAEEWPHVAKGLKELAYVCKRRGLYYKEFLEIRRDIIQALEQKNQLARTHIELEEKNEKDRIIGNQSQP